MERRQRIIRLLSELPGGTPLLALYEGLEYAPLTDYFLQPLTEAVNHPPPAEYVDGKTLLPAFRGSDWSAIYCIDGDSGQFVEIDPEAPWPPRRTFETYREFREHLFRVASEFWADHGQDSSRLAEILDVG